MILKIQKTETQCIQKPETLNMVNFFSFRPKHAFLNRVKTYDQYLLTHGDLTENLSGTGLLNLTIYIFELQEICIRLTMPNIY